MLRHAANALLILKISVFDRIHAGLHCIDHGLRAVHMRHHGKSRLVRFCCHPKYFLSRKRFARHISFGGKIQNSRRHDFNKITAGLIHLTDKFFILFPVRKRASDNFSVMIFFMNSKNGRVIGNSIFRREVPRKDACPVRIASVTYIRNPRTSVRFQMLPDQILARSRTMCLCRLFIIYTVHENMCMAFCSHHLSLPPDLRFYHNFSPSHLPVLFREI